MKTCESCRHFDEHPFIRENDWTSYCMLTDNITTHDETCNAYELDIDY